MTTVCSRFIRSLSTRNIECGAYLGETIIVLYCRGDPSPCDLPERVALDATASLARRVGASGRPARGRDDPGGRVGRRGEGGSVGLGGPLWSPAVLDS